MRVAFINENTLGHTSYLPVFCRWFQGHPELGIEPVLINAAPLPPSIARWADTTVPLLRRWALDFFTLRWRLGASLHAARQLDALRARQSIDAVVVNTQSVGLRLPEAARHIPVLACLDATFDQLRRSPWFAPDALSRAASIIPMAVLRSREQKLFDAAAGILPWSEAARKSLLRDYRIDSSRVTTMPPSINLEAIPRRSKPPNLRPQILFLGGDFKRKGGPLLLECFQKHLAGQCELRIVTRSPLDAPDGVFVHRNIEAGSAEWLERWTAADLFVFPSALETFGIVLLEALAFAVPVISSDCGAAAEILEGGAAGTLLRERSVETLRAAILNTLAEPGQARERAARGRQIVETRYNLRPNAERLARMLIESPSKLASSGRQ